ncbi:MAG: histone deacetylase [Anaerolineales bacterium]
MRVGVLYSDKFLEHETGAHPESPRRLQAIMAELEQSGLLRRVTMVTPRPATERELTLVHNESLIYAVRGMAALGGGALGYDTVLSAGSYKAALLAAGGTVDLVRSVCRGEFDRGLALVRPPGHHATRRDAMGFCLFNNIAIATAAILHEGLARRVAIVDFDVHHGNGTAEAFESNSRVLYISTHEHPLFPGTGALDEVGIASGMGKEINIPLPAGVGDIGWRRVYEGLVFPALERFGADLLLISAGYDVHWSDPLAHLQVSVAGIHWLISRLMDYADRYCGGKAVAVLEGGYRLDALAHGVCATLAAMLGEPYPDELGPSPRREPDITGLIAKVAQIHGLPLSGR